jgi:hypothetical protein
MSSGEGDPGWFKLDARKGRKMHLQLTSICTEYREEARLNGYSIAMANTMIFVG